MEEAFEINSMQSEANPPLDSSHAHAGGKDSMSGDQGKLTTQLGQAWVLWRTEPEAAEALAEHLLEKAMERSARRSELSILELLCRTSNRLGKFQWMGELATRAQKLAVELGDTRSLACGLIQEGTATWRLGKLQEGLELYGRALELNRALEDKELEAEAVERSVFPYLSTGRLREALQAALRGVELYRGLGDPFWTCGALNSLGLCYDFLSDHARALEMYQEGLRLAREHNPPTVAAILANIGRLYVERSEYAEARRCFEQSLALSLKYRRHGDTATQYHNLGVTLSELGEYAQAVECFQKTLTLERQAGSTRIISECLNNLGDVHRSHGEFRQARTCYEEALQLSRESGYEYASALHLHSLAILHLHPDNTDRDETLGMELLTAALELSERLELRRERSRLLRTHSDIQSRRQQFKEALESFKAHHELEHTLNSRATEERLALLRVSWEVDQARRDAEIARLRNVELAEALAQAEALRKVAEHEREVARHLARIDALTGIFNRRVLEEKAAEEHERARRYSHPLSMCLMDIDFFKRVNDDFSHQVGDEVIRRVANLLTQGLRTSDTVARYGGEEFAIVLPETPHELALATCERLRRSIELHAWEEVSPGLVITASFGICSDLNLSNHEKMFAFADKKLYEAKHLGRNRVAG